MKIFAKASLLISLFSTGALCNANLMTHVEDIVNYCIEKPIGLCEKKIKGNSKSKKDFIDALQCIKESKEYKNAVDKKFGIGSYDSVSKTSALKFRPLMPNYKKAKTRIISDTSFIYSGERGDSGLVIKIKNEWFIDFDISNTAHWSNSKNIEPMPIICPMNVVMHELITIYVEKSKSLLDLSNYMSDFAIILFDESLSSSQKEGASSIYDRIKNRGINIKAEKARITSRCNEKK